MTAIAPGGLGIAAATSVALALRLAGLLGELLAAGTVEAAGWLRVKPLPGHDFEH